MNEDDILKRLTMVYIYLIHPLRENGLFAKEIKVAVHVAPVASDNMLDYQ